MKKLVLLTPLLLLSLVGCGNNTKKKEPTPIPDEEDTPVDPTPTFDYAPINKELLGCYNYFIKTSNYKEGSSGYGLALDRYSNKASSSIAATGFLLASYPVFVEQGYMTKESAFDIVDKSLDTLLAIQNDNSTSYAGCISHFVDISTGVRLGESEVSTIDTAILVSGAIAAGEYFEGSVKQKATQLWSNVDYTQFAITKNNRPYISMGVKSPSNHTQLSPWDYYAEQLMIYILGAGNPNENHRISATFYKNITKNKGVYKGIEHIYSWFGSLFTYQFSHAFFNFKEYNDYKGVNYFTNSVNASKTAYQYCQDRSEYYKSFSESSWGLTACDTPLGYSGLLGTPPRGYQDASIEYQRIEGTVAPTAALGSMPFTPEESYRALKYYQSLNQLNDSYFGLRDSFNLDFVGQEWFCGDFIGIDKGIEVLQLYNFKNTDFVSNLAMNNENIILGFTNNEFVKVS